MNKRIEISTENKALFHRHDKVQVVAISDLMFCDMFWITSANELTSLGRSLILICSQDISSRFNAQALMYLDYCHQILYKIHRILFSRFSIFTECCQKVQLPAALLTCFLCALTVFYVNVRYFPLTVSVGISSLHLLDVPIKLIFIDSCGNPYMGNADKTLTVSLTKSRYRRNMQSQYSVKF